MKNVERTPAARRASRIAGVGTPEAPQSKVSAISWRAVLPRTISPAGRVTRGGGTGVGVGGGGGIGVGVGGSGVAVGSGVGVDSSPGGSIGFEALAEVPPQATERTRRAQASSSKQFFMVK